MKMAFGCKKMKTLACVMQIYLHEAYFFVFLQKYLHKTYLLCLAGARYLHKVEPLKLCLAGGDSNFNMMPKTFEWMQKLRAFDEMQKLKSGL